MDDYKKFGYKLRLQLKDVQKHCVGYKTLYGFSNEAIKQMFAKGKIAYMVSDKISGTATLCIKHHLLII